MPLLTARQIYPTKGEVGTEDASSHVVPHMRKHISISSIRATGSAGEGIVGKSIVPYKAEVDGWLGVFAVELFPIVKNPVTLLGACSAFLIHNRRDPEVAILRRVLLAALS